MGQSTPVHTRSLGSFEELKDAVRGAHLDIVQLESGRFHGSLTHLSIDDLPVDFGTFSVGIRSQGILSGNRIAIGMLTGSAGRTTQWFREMHPGDVTVTPPGHDHDGRYYGGASYAVISLSPSEMHSFFSGEPRMQDENTWQQNLFRGAFRFSELPISRLNSILAGLQNRNTTLTNEASGFWKRSIIETMMASVRLNLPSDRDGPLPSALKIIRKMEDYLVQSGTTPVHISEICGALNVSRRTLHRAFHDAVGIGPVTFLQRKRLCNIHSVLRTSDSATTTIAEIALQHGFLNLGRFSGYYRALFGEYPSETFGKSHPNQDRTLSE